MAQVLVPEEQEKAKALPCFHLLDNSHWEHAVTLTAGPFAENGKLLLTEKASSVLEDNVSLLRSHLLVGASLSYLI